MPSKTLRETYGLEYETENLQYGLPAWYNQTLDKTRGELNVFDVGKMLRQAPVPPVLKELAKRRAVELFLNDPFDGEVYMGEIVETVLRVSLDGSDAGEREAMLAKIAATQARDLTDDDIDGEDRERFYQDLAALKKRLLDHSA